MSECCATEYSFTHSLAQSICCAEEWLKYICTYVWVLNLGINQLLWITGKQNTWRERDREITIDLICVYDWKSHSFMGQIDDDVHNQLSNACLWDFFFYLVNCLIQNVLYAFSLYPIKLRVLCQLHWLFDLRKNNSNHNTHSLWYVITANDCAVSSNFSSDSDLIKLEICI